MSGAAVGVAAAAAAGPAGVLPSKSRAPARVLQRPGETGRALLCKDPHLQGAPALKVSLLRWNFTSVCSASVRFFSLIAGQRADEWEKQKRKEWSNKRGIKAEEMTWNEAGAKKACGLRLLCFSQLGQTPPLPDSPTTTALASILVVISFLFLSNVTHVTQTKTQEWRSSEGSPMQNPSANLLLGTGNQT